MPNGTTTKAAFGGLSITEEITIGRIEPTPSKAYEVSLIDSNRQKYVSIRQQYKKRNNNEWQPKSTIWIPFTNGEEISRLMQQACEEGNKRNWGVMPTQPATQASAPSLDVEKELLEVKAKLENLEIHIHNMEANKEQKAHLKLIERILKALS